MKTRLERIEGNEVALEIEVDAEQFGVALHEAYRRLARRANIPGFRKGKVPRQVLEAFMGKQVLVEEACEHVIPEAFGQAVKETEIEPVARPRIDLVQAEEGKPLVFKANVVVKPEPKLGRIVGLEVEVPPMAVTDEDVEQRLKTMQERYSRLIKVEDDSPAAMGDILTIDFTGYLGEEPFPGGSGQDYSLELGSGTFIPGFEEQLAGARTGEEKEVNVTFPSDYHAEELRDQNARFTVNIKEIKKREVSPLDDNFALEVSEFETLEELKADVRKNMEEMAAKSREQVLRSRVIARAVEEAEVDVPVEMVENQINRLISQFAERLNYQGMNLEAYLNYTGTTEMDLREEFRPQAEQNIKDNLVLEAIAGHLELKVTEEDFEKQVEKAAAEFNMPVEEIRKNLEDARERIEYGILIDKAVDYLTENAVIKEVEENKEENAG